MSNSELPTKDDLERRKLALEIGVLQAPFRNSPALWLSTATTFVAVCAFFFQLSLSRYESLVAEQKSLMAKVERAQAQLDTEKIKKDLSNLKQELAATTTQVTQAQAALKETQQNLTIAKALLTEAQITAPPTLQTKIRDFKTFEEKSKYYDPTGKRPYHVPPAE